MMTKVKGYFINACLIESLKHRHELCIYYLSINLPEISIEYYVTGSVASRQSPCLQYPINHILDNTALYPKLRCKLQQKLSRVTWPKVAVIMNSHTNSIFIFKYCVLVLTFPPHFHIPLRWKNSIPPVTIVRVFFAIKIGAAHLCQRARRKTKNEMLMPIISIGISNIDILLLCFTSPLATNLFRLKPSGETKKHKQAKRTMHISISQSIS